MYQMSDDIIDVFNHLEVSGGYTRDEREQISIPIDKSDAEKNHLEISRDERVEILLPVGTQSDAKKPITKNDERCSKLLQKDAAWGITHDTTHQLISLDKTTPEYEFVQTKFLNSLRNPHIFTIEDIKRVENMFLLTQYRLRKEQLLQEFYGIREEQLFHGTNTENVDKICENNFNWRLRGQARGHKFGQGVSFSPRAEYARHYSYTYPGAMIFADVLVGRKYVGNRFTEVPVSGYDTTTNRNEDVIVKYNDNEFMPKYIIYYT